jgi:hypothetical protein
VALVGSKAGGVGLPCELRVVLGFGHQGLFRLLLGFRVPIFFVG